MKAIRYSTIAEIIQITANKRGHKIPYKRWAVWAWVVYKTLPVDHLINFIVWQFRRHERLVKKLSKC